jgi:quercetin dioxygenase-like cupin family protein
MQPALQRSLQPVDSWKGIEVMIRDFARFGLITFMLAASSVQVHAQAPSSSDLLLLEFVDGVPQIAQPEVRMLTTRLAPGGTSSWRIYSSPTIIYVLSGQLRLEMEDKPPITVANGEGFVETVGVVMRRANPSGTDVLELLEVQLGDPIQCPYYELENQERRPSPEKTS